MCKNVSEYWVFTIVWILDVHKSVRILNVHKSVWILDVYKSV